MQDTLQGMQNNQMLTHDVVVTGYTRSVQVLAQVEEAIKKIKENNPNMIYVCDPVLGDDGKFYVPEEVLDFYKNRLIPISFAITPNYFEA